MMLGIGKEHCVENNNYKSDAGNPNNESHPEWCQYCAHFGSAEYYNACADTPMWYLLPYGPQTVSFCGHCRNFTYGLRMGGKVAKHSALKNLILKAYGFKYQDQKTR